MNASAQGHGGAEAEFEAVPSADPKGWFCSAGMAEFALLLTTYAIEDTVTQTAITDRDRLRWREDNDGLHDGFWPLQHLSKLYDNGQQRLDAFKKCGLTNQLRSRNLSRPHVGALIDQGLIVKTTELRAIQELIPRQVRFESQNLEAQEVEQHIIRDPAIIYVLFEELKHGAYLPEPYPAWHIEEEDDDCQYRVRVAETALDFAKRIHAPLTLAQECFEWLGLCGNDAGLVRKLRARTQTPTTPIRFLVDGLIATNVVTLLGGCRKAGKSSAVTELAAVTASGGGSWAGFSVLPEACEGFVLLFGGEDSQDMIGDRIHRLYDGGDAPPRLIVHGNEETDLKRCLSVYHSAKISLIIVDPSRKYYSGDEDGSDAPNNLFNILERAAVHHNCAVLMTHHPRKDARPANLSELAAALRGSALWLDRPRAVIGLLRQHDETTIIGIPTEAGGNPLHNFPAKMMFAGHRRLRRDDQFHKLIPIESDGQSAAPDCNAVLRAIDALSATQSGRVTKSGKRGLFEMWPGVVERLPRARVHAACDALIASGKIVLIDGALCRAD